MGETERLTSIPYTNPMGSDHMGVLLDITPNHWRYMYPNIRYAYECIAFKIDQIILEVKCEIVMPSYSP